MRVHDPLDKILNNGVKVKTLRFLCKTEAEKNFYSHKKFMKFLECQTKV